MNAESLDNVIKSLKKRIFALEDQYKGFVKYCIEMIKHHRLIIDSELKNDPNTPRELLFQISQHGETLENRVRMASDSLHIPSSNKLKNLESFKSEFYLLLNHDPYKIEQFSILFSSLEQFIRENFIKKDESRKFDLKKPINTQKNLQESENLESKIDELQNELLEKDKKLKVVYEQLEKIKKLQAINTKNINEHCISLNQSKVVNTSCSRGYESVLTPDLNSNNSLRTEESFDSKYFYNVVCKKLVNLAGIVRKFTQRAWIYDGSKGQNPDFDLVLENFRMDTEEIEKVIEDIITPRFKEDLTERSKDSEIPSQLKRLKTENSNLISELKARDLKILALDNKKSSLVLEIKSLKQKLKDYIGQIDELQLKNYEILKENSNFKEKINDFEGKKKFLSVQRLNSDLLEKSAEVCSVVIERNMEIVLCSEVFVKNVYRNENLIREIRKMLKDKEKECIDKELQIKELQKCSNFESKPIKPELLSIKNKFSYEENYNLNKKLSSVLVEKTKIEENLQKSENFCQQLTTENDQLKLNLVQIELELSKLNSIILKKKNSCMTALNSQISVRPKPSETLLKSALKAKKEKYLSRLQQSQSQHDQLKSDLQRLQTLLTQTQEHLKTALSQNENSLDEFNKKILNYERQSSLLIGEKTVLAGQLEENKKKFEEFKERLLISLQLTLKAVKESCEKNIEEVNSHTLALFKTIESKVMQKLLNMTKCIKKIQGSAMKLRILYQNSLSNTKFLTMRIEDKENSLLTLNSSLKLAESTILSYMAEKKDFEREKELLSSRISALNSEISIFKSQKPEKISDKSMENDYIQVNQVLQSQVQLLNNECKKLEAQLKESKTASIKEKENFEKKMDSLAKQLANSNIRIEELKSNLKIDENWKNKEYEVVKCVKYCDTTWLLIHVADENLVFWTDQQIQSDVRDEFEELKVKYEKIKNYCFRIREEYKKLKRKVDVYKKNYEADRGCWDNKEDVSEFISPFVSPRDADIHQIFEGLRSARSLGTEFEDDTLGELSSKIVKEGNSIFNASSFDDLNEDTDKMNQLLDKMNAELQMKNELIKNYENTISELKLLKEVKS